nr:hypothetical protein [Tanacetum cinerariifolium]
MADNRTMVQMLQAPIEGYEDAIVDVLDSAVGGNFLDKIPRECLSIIESKSKVRYSRIRVTDGEGKVITTRSGMSYKELPIPPTGVNQQEPVEVTTDMEPQSSDDIHPPTVQAEVQVDELAEEPSVFRRRTYTHAEVRSNV